MNTNLIDTVATALVAAGFCVTVTETDWGQVRICISEGYILPCGYITAADITDGTYPHVIRRADEIAACLHSI